MKKWLFTPLAAVALLAGPAAAQRPLIPGELARGALSTSDPRLPDDTYYDEWSFTGRRGETVVVTMESRAFDAYLYVGTLRGGVFRELRRDDDGGGGTNARIELQLPEGGTYVVRASSLATQTGPYTLSLAAGRTRGGGWDDRPEPGRPSRDGYLEPGRTIRGRLSDSDPKLDNGAAFHTYRYAGRRGERLTLTLRSVDFDAYLVVGTPGGRHGIQTALARDDDGGGGHDARLVHTFQGDGEYVVRVNSLLPGTGRYTLEVESSMYDGPAGPDDAWEEEEDPGYEEEDDGGIDQRLVGRWGLVPPTARVDAGSWSSISANARMGILTIDEEGAYTWRTNGRTLRGQLVPITPRGGALAGTEYYAVNDGRGEFYIFLAPYRGGERMQVSSRATDRLVAHGYSDGALR